jgi:uncharacterized phage-associated protein
VTSARAVANEFISLAAAEGKYLTPMQIMKLVYIAHGWSLALNQRPLFSDRIEAWKYGPVIPGLYQDLKTYGSGSVTAQLRTGVFGGSATTPDDDDRKFIESVYKSYGALNGLRLSAMTHEDGTPWSQTYKSGNMNLEISNDLIVAHYQRLWNERAKRSA